MLSLKKKLTCILIITLNAALLCCTAPRTARWIWCSINKIIIIIKKKKKKKNAVYLIIITDQEATLKKGYI